MFEFYCLHYPLNKTPVIKFVPLCWKNLVNATCRGLLRHFFANQLKLSKRRGQWPGFPPRCGLVRAYTNKIMPHMKLIYFFNTNLNFFKSTHFKNFPANDETKSRGNIVNDYIWFHKLNDVIKKKRQISAN